MFRLRGKMRLCPENHFYSEMATGFVKRRAAGFCLHLGEAHSTGTTSGADLVPLLSKPKICTRKSPQCHVLGAAAGGARVTGGEEREAGRHVHSSSSPNASLLFQANANKRLIFPPWAHSVVYYRSLGIPNIYRPCTSPVLTYVYTTNKILIAASV